MVPEISDVENQGIEMQDQLDINGKTKQELIEEQKEYFMKRDEELEAQLEKDRFNE